MSNLPSETGGTSFASLVTGPPGREVSYPVRSAVAKIGNGPQNDIVLDDDSVSTTHARLEFTEGRWRLTDLQSRNGTFVDGNRLVPGTGSELTDGALVAFGAVKSRFRMEAAPAAVDSAGTAAPIAASPPRKKGGLRVPVWLVVLVVLLIVAVVLTMTLGSGAAPEPSPSGVGWLLIDDQPAAITA